MLSTVQRGTEYHVFLSTSTYVLHSAISAHVICHEQTLMDALV